MIVEHGAVFIDSRQEEVGRLDLRQAGHVGGSTGQLAAELVVELIDDTCVLEEPPDPIRLVGEDLCCEVTGDCLVVASEGTNARCRIVGSKCGECCHVDARGPSFGAAVEQRHVDARRIEPDLGDQFARLFEVETELGPAEFVDLVLQAKAVEPEGGLGAAADQEADVRQPTLEELTELLSSIGGHELEVVDHQSDSDGATRGGRR